LIIVVGNSFCLFLRLALSSWSSCLNLPSAGITGVNPMPDWQFLVMYWLDYMLTEIKISKLDYWVHIKFFVHIFLGKQLYIFFLPNRWF
jgi:hypothetical protein